MDCRLSRSLDGNFILQTPETDFMGRSRNTGNWKKVFQTADITLATSYGDAENFRKAGANSACITNGFDKEELTKKSVKIQSSHFLILEFWNN
jgi:hypothetical protein